MTYERLLDYRPISELQRCAYTVTYHKRAPRRVTSPDICQAPNLGKVHGVHCSAARHVQQSSCQGNCPVRLALLKLLWLLLWAFRPKSSGPGPTSISNHHGEQITQEEISSTLSYFSLARSFTAQSGNPVDSLGVSLSAVPASSY